MLLSYITHLNITLQREIRMLEICSNLRMVRIHRCCPLCPLHEQWLMSEDVKHLMFINSSKFSAVNIARNRKISWNKTGKIYPNAIIHHHHQFRNVSLLLIYSIRFYYRWSIANFMFVLFSIYPRSRTHQE